MRPCSGGPICCCKRACRGGRSDPLDVLVDLQRSLGPTRGKVAISPAVEEQYKVLTRDYDTRKRTIRTY